MAMGKSANAVREQFMLDASFFLYTKQFALLEFPDERWYQRQREGTGMESWLYTHLKLAKCDAVVRFGFDEPEIRFPRSSSLSWNFQTRGGISGKEKEPVWKVRSDRGMGWVVVVLVVVKVVEMVVMLLVIMAAKVIGGMVVGMEVRVVI